MYDDKIELLARENNGAIQVDDAMEHEPLLLVLAGPIKVWWDILPDGSAMWDTPQRVDHFTWRDAVQTAVIKDGHLTYNPHRAWRGSWHEAAQRINDAAIREADVIVVRTPPGVQADGTAAEEVVAHECGTPVLYAPPSDENGMQQLLEDLNKLRAQLGKS